MDGEAFPNSKTFPNVGGDLGKLIREYDWSSTPLGASENWPQSLRTITEMLLLSPVPIVLLWGEDGIMIYNDAYSEFAGSRHPKLLGLQSARGLARSRRIQRQCHAGRALRRNARLPRPGTHPATPRQARIGLDESRILARARRGGQAGRRDRHRHRDDPAGARRAQRQRKRDAASRPGQRHFRRDLQDEP